ncbi:cupredoxin domain-containing protein [Metabacillus sp. HB246100]|uniref:cupredoxin domain-containing protein n=1 Tax=Bacillus weihaiensis TaxID=1547283 RepID=UPI0023522D54|nr:cupredoxin domain-containing protein [Bacillus weihaiensis]
MRFIIIKRKWLLICLFVILVGSFYLVNNQSLPTFSPNKEESNRLVINMVTGEFSSTLSDGKKIEAYRWDPGTILIPKDENVTLSIYGVNGEEHPFYIEGTDIKGVVKKGEETIIPLHFKEEGTYRLICDTHTHQGHTIPPMVAYLVVD